MTVRLGLVGAGLVGQQHVRAIARSHGAVLAAVADPEPDAIAGLGVPVFRDLENLIASNAVDGVILATPNQLHAEQARQAIDAGLPALIEKPFTDDIAAGEAVCAAAEAAGVPLLTGHHRRYNPIVQKARALIEAGDLGRVLSLTAACWLKKPDAYFAPVWRREKGAGPVLVNLIHDVDLMRYFCGDVRSVQAQSASTARGHAVEDTAAALLTFASGAIGTMTVSDAIPAPISWELTAGENPAYPRTSQNCYWLGGSTGTLALPSLTLWRHDDPQGWWQPISAKAYPTPTPDPLAAQIDHFAQVIADGATPLVSGRDGLEAVRIIDAILRSAETRSTVTL